MIVRRLLTLIPLLLFVSFAVYALVLLIPGDAAETLAGGINATPDQIEAVREELHLNEPFLQQYGTWLGGVVQGDFGNSLENGQPISSELADRIPVTLGVVAAALIIIVPIALLTGIIGGLRPGSVVDRVLLLFTSLLVSIPGFLLALVLVSVFAVWLKWLPPYGYTPFTEDPVGWARNMVMPAIALGLAAAAVTGRQLRGGLADTMTAPYIRTAWAKGGGTRQVVVGHALQNSAIPAVTVLGLQIGALVGGTVLIEQIFQIQGMGTYLLNAINLKNLPVIQACTLLFVVIYVFVNLLVDIAYTFLDPRVRVR